MVIKHLAVQTLDALVWVDVALRMKSLDGSFVGTSLAGVAAFAITPQPVKQP